MTTQELLQKAKGAKIAMALASTETKNKALSAMADALERHQAEILAANQLDLDAARGTISSVMLDRLALNPDRIAGMAKGIREVVELPDPAGAVLNRVERPSGIVVEKTAVPMGVIAIIYESRAPGGQGGPPLCRRHCGRSEGGPVCRRPARGRPSAGGGHHPRLLQ